MTTNDARRKRALALQLHGVLAHWSDCAEQAWLEPLLAWEESERSRRSLERRLRCAHTVRCPSFPITACQSPAYTSRAPAPIRVVASGGRAARTPPGPY